MNNINAILNSIEQPSLFKGEKQEIQRFTNQVAEYLPEGVDIVEVLDNLPDDVPYSTSLKILIELAKNKLLNFTNSDLKIKPLEVLKILGNPQDISKRAEFNMNEIRIQNKNYEQIWDKCWLEACDKIGEWLDIGEDEEELENEDEVSEYARDLFKEKTEINYCYIYKLDENHISLFKILNEISK